ncbi:MAG: hypothetical protein IJF03_00355 [Lachnospiraceae bacterium]|nr:hypothetical protein [Lachnospiraceae bacterium]
MEKINLRKLWEAGRRILVLVVIASILCGLISEYSNVYAEKNDSLGNTITKDVPEDITGEIEENDILASSGSKTIYFDTVTNGNWSGNTDGWTQNCNMYIYLIGTSGTIQPMSKSSKENTLMENSSGTLWEYTISEADASKCTGVIFINQSSWGTNNNAVQTVDVSLTTGNVSTDSYPCFKLNGGASSEGKKTVDYLGSLATKSYGGSTMYFFDMTGNLDSVLAKFGNENNGTVITNMTEDAGIEGLYKVTVPADDQVAYSTVEFYDADTSLGESYNFANAGADGYDVTARNTLYYGASEINKAKYSFWGKKVTGSQSLAGKTLYFDRLYFPVTEGCQIQAGSQTAIDLPATGSEFSYTFSANSAATQQTVLTFINKEGTKHHFFWSDLTKNEVTVIDKFAGVNKTYSNALTVYFDATLSKLTYSYADGTNGGANGNSDYGIPNKSGRIRYYATGAGKTDIEGDMQLVPVYSNGTNTYSDVYKVELPEGYTNIAFSSFDMSNITNHGGHGESTKQLTIPTNLSNPCFYADSSDNVIYDGGQRDGYWGEVYTVRNPEQEGSASNTIVDIPKEKEVKDVNKLYLSTTFYDFYTDYELNGWNRDNYGYDANNHRIYQPFRQFDQALSEFYKANNAASPLYWGNFQNYTGSPFSEITADLNLYGSGDTKKFFYENNSMWDRNGGDLDKQGTNGENATLGLVSNTLSNGNLMLKTASGGTVQAPFLNEEFLNGNNAKNTVLGKVYKNVDFPFSKQELNSQSAPDVSGKVAYWVFDSKDASTNLRLTQDPTTNNYYLNCTNKVVKGKTTEGITASGNFFPFNGTEQSGNSGKLNYGFASKLEMKFRLTEDGTVHTTDGDEAPIEFNFSGDDDVWIFIDGKLALDIGGGHGVVTGYLNFKDLTYYVSRVKNTDTSGGYRNKYTGSFSLNGDKTEEHTLTMFYMERGIWESNMYISFNFPDENTFEVEKEVDDSGVNQDLFAGVFDNASIFPFEIKNLATHYGPQEVDYGDEKKPVTFNDTFASGTLNKGSVGNTFEQVAEFNGQSQAVHYKAMYSDTAGAYKDKRFGIIAPASGQTIDVSEVKKYLRFQYYYDENDKPALNHMYMELEDASGNTVGGYLNGKTYITTAMRSKEWSTITIDLSKLTGSLNFDYSKLKYIKFDYNYDGDFYLDGFEFFAQSDEDGIIGFTTKQYEIPDYGSATSGKLEIPKGARYTLNSEGSATYYSRLGTDGIFNLKNGEWATFNDQFRVGSYISLKENIDTDVFDSSYTVYENGSPVTSMADGATVNLGTTTNLANIKSVAVDDGRTEVYLSGKDTESKDYGNAGYTKTQKPSDNTIVFRSYTNPDSNMGITKIKIVYTNTVKTGELTIRKANAYNTDNLTGEYKFKVTFSNVAGLGLEGENVITKEITLKAGESETISGIPINTDYEIEEIVPEDGSVLDSVTEKSGYDFDMDVQTKKVTGTISASAKSYDFTFKNTQKPVVSMKLVKLWKDSQGNDMKENIPDSIDVQIQRRAKGSTGSYSVVSINGQNKITMQPGYDVWEYSLEGLDQYVDYTVDSPVEWEYRVVELDADGNVIEEGGFVGSYKVSYEINEQTKTITGTITNTYQSTHVKVIKVDATDNSIKLSDVEFTLEKLKDDGTVDNTFTKVTAKTEIDGTAVFSDLKDGTYRLTETKAKEGYSLLKKSIRIVINRSGQSTIDDKNCSVEADIISVTIANRQKFSLPFTGGYGRTVFFLLGIICIGVAAAVYLYKKKNINIIVLIMSKIEKVRKSYE